MIKFIIPLFLRIMCFNNCGDNLTTLISCVRIAPSFYATYYLFKKATDEI